VGLPDAAVKESRTGEDGYREQRVQVRDGSDDDQSGSGRCEEGGAEFRFADCDGILAVSEQIVAPNLDDFAMWGSWR